MSTNMTGFRYLRSCALDENSHSIGRVKGRVVELKPQTYVRLLSFIFLIVALQLFRGGISVALKQFIVVILLQFSS